MDLDRVRKAAGDSARIVVLTGAGVSAESGVPTFRGGGGAAVWKGMDATELSSTRTVENNLPLAWEWFEYRRGLVSSCNPNPAHEAISAWQKRFQSFTLVTQNIDGLHDRAGSRDVLELHGNMWRGRCTECRRTEALLETPLEHIPPACGLCSSPLRPDVVLFGEMLPAGVFEQAAEACRACALCFVVGTSSVVYPAAELPAIALHSGALVVEVNPEPTGLAGTNWLVLEGNAGEVLPNIWSESL